MFALELDHFIALFSNVVYVNDLFFGLLESFIFFLQEFALNFIIVLSYLLFVMFIYGVHCAGWEPLFLVILSFKNWLMAFGVCYSVVYVVLYLSILAGYGLVGVPCLAQLSHYMGSSIFLYFVLLFNCPYFSGCVRVQITLLQLLQNTIKLLYHAHMIMLVCSYF